MEENLFLLPFTIWVENSGRPVSLRTSLVWKNNVFIATKRGKKKLKVICFRKTPFERRVRGGRILADFVLIGLTVNLAVWL